MRIFFRFKGSSRMKNLVARVVFDTSRLNSFLKLICFLFCNLETSTVHQPFLIFIKTKYIFFIYEIDFKS